MMTKPRIDLMNTQREDVALLGPGWEPRIPPLLADREARSAFIRGVLGLARVALCRRIREAAYSSRVRLRRRSRSLSVCVRSCVFDASRFPFSCLCSELCIRHIRFLAFPEPAQRICCPAQCRIYSTHTPLSYTKGIIVVPLRTR